MMEQVNLKSKDGTIIRVKSAKLKQSGVLFARLQEMLTAENSADFIVHVPEADAMYLNMMVKWMSERPTKKESETTDSENSEIPNNQEQHVPAPNLNNKFDHWDVHFFQTHRKEAFRLMAVAKRLEIDSFLQIFGRVLYASMSKKSSEQIQQLVCINNRSEGTINFEGSDSVFSVEMSLEESEITY